MVFYKKNKSNNKIYISIGNTENFREILEILKTSQLNYNLEDKGWYGKNNSLYVAFQEIIKIEEINISSYILDEIKPKFEIKKVRRKINTDLFKSPPIKGKKPYEDYQLDDLKFFTCMNRGGIFWQMGLGKSWEIVNIINQLIYHKEISKIVFISPISGLLNLKYELLKFSDYFKEEDIYIANVNNREPFNSDCKVIIMTYRTFLMISEDAYKLTKNYENKVKLNEKKPKKEQKKKSELLNFSKEVLPIKQWLNNSNALICLDESHNISNYSAKQSKALHIHKKFFEYRYIMTGTPADKIEKYYSQMKFLDDNLIPESYIKWLESIAVLGNDFSQYAITEYKQDGVNKFIEKIKPYIRRRLSEECLDLPENIINKNIVSFNEKQLQIYLLLIEQELNIIKKEKGYIESKALANKFPYIRQALDNPCLLKDKIDKNNNPKLYNLVNNFRFNEHSKIEVIDELLENYIKNEKRKVILWDFHPITMNLLSEHYKKYNPLVIHGELNLNGKSMSDYRDEIINLFKTSSKHNLLIASMLILDTAVTITEANRQIYFCRNDMMVKFSQSMKRMHRIGQKEQVITNIPLIEKSLEMNWDKNMDNKINLDKYLLKKKFLTENEVYDIFTGNVND